MANIVIKKLLRKPGGENMGGYQNRLLFYPAHLMKTVPTLITAPTTTQDLAMADGAFEFHVEADKPIAIDATDKTVSMKAENQGETDGQSFKVTGGFFHPGVGADASGFARLVNNTPGYLVVVSPEGDQFIVGQPGLEANIKPSFDGGQQRTDRRGFSFEFEADSYAPYIKLKSPIDFSPYFKAE